MFETGLPKSETRVECRWHGELIDGSPSVVWRGGVQCGVCMRVYPCDEHEKRVYPNVPDDGFCLCGSALFPFVGAAPTSVFSAYAKCDQCIRALWTQQHPEPKTETATP